MELSDSGTLKNFALSEDALRKILGETTNRQKRAREEEDELLPAKRIVAAPEDITPLAHARALQALSEQLAAAEAELESLTKLHHAHRRRHLEDRARGLREAAAALRDLPLTDEARSALLDLQNVLPPDCELPLAPKVSSAPRPSAAPQKELCAACGSAVQLHTTLSMLVCSTCGLGQPFLDTTASLLCSHDDSHDCASFSYKRVNHFLEFLSSMQAREHTDIPEEVLASVMEKLKEERVPEDAVTASHVRDALKKLKHRKLYEHSQLIACKLTNRMPPKMTPEQEERVRTCFIAATNAFQRLRPRKNFLSYSFCASRIFAMLGYYEFVPYCTLIKGNDKLQRAQAVWVEICKECNWPVV